MSIFYKGFYPDNITDGFIRLWLEIDGSTSDGFPVYQNIAPTAPFLANFRELPRPRLPNGSAQVGGQRSASDDLVKKLFWLAVVLNLLDLAGTIILLKLGATEANPIMAALIGKSVWLFVGVKALVVPLAAWLLYKSKSKKLLWTCCAAYGLVCCLHIFLLVTHAF